MPGGWHCRAFLFQHLCTEAHASLYVAFEIESGCTMEIIRSGTQYRQAPHLWGDPLTPDRAKKRRLPEMRQFGFSVEP